MQMSGGHLLAAGLDGGNTIISSNPSSSAGPTPCGVVFFFASNPSSSNLPTAFVMGSSFGIESFIRINGQLNMSR